MDELDRHSTRIAARNVAEIAFVAAVASIAIIVGWRIAGENPLGRQFAVWIANVLMLTAVWIGLRLRRQTWEHFGLRTGPVDRRSLWRTGWQSILVLAFALVAFMVGSVVASMLFGQQAQSDMSGYSYLQGNLPLFLLALAGVYVVSSFGEEAIYRGFLMTRVAEMVGEGRAGQGVAVGVSAAVFGMIHFGWGAFGIVQTTFLGAALGIAYLLLKRNLWPLIIAHAILDTMLLLPLYFAATPGS